MKTIQASANFTAEQVPSIQRHLQKKLWCLCKEYIIPPTNIYNIDETMVAICPLPHQGWCVKGSAPKPLVKTSHLKLGITVTVVFPMVGLGGAWAQMIVEGGIDQKIALHSMFQRKCQSMSEARCLTCTCASLAEVAQASVSPLTYRSSSRSRTT
eukprot:1396737-Amphidinium_carterae.2